MAEPEITNAEEALLAAVAVRRKRDLSVLTDRQEKLIDDWRAGRLAADQALEAEKLVRNSAAAAERVLERQLMEAAEASPPISSELEARILAAVVPQAAPKQTQSFFRLPRLQMWQVSSLAGALAAVVAVFVSLPQLTGGGPVQLAMASISDRDVLFEAADVRTRGAAQSAPSPQRFKDFVIPASTLQGLLDTSHSRAQKAALDDFRKRAGISDEKVLVIVDAALAQRAPAKDAASVGVRLYDLQDSRVADVRSKMMPSPPPGAAYLVTVKP